LLANVPTLESRKKSFALIKGEIPSPIDPPTGCHFHPRCPHTSSRCKAEIPQLKELSSGCWSACHLNDG
jgi:peptide/nickel transport system ATP-binding protein